MLTNRSTQISPTLRETVANNVSVGIGYFEKLVTEFNGFKN